MKLRRIISCLLVLVLMVSTVAFAASAAQVDIAETQYYNQNYLEDIAAKAKNVDGLGATYTEAATTFKVWAPTAETVLLKMFATGTDAESGAAVLGTHKMTKDANTGVWSITLDGDHKNEYYTYLVTVDGTTNETQDPYAIAVGANGERSMVCDLDSTDPEGWDEDEHVLFDSSAEAVVWEVHVRDFSISDSSGVSDEYQGKYLAFTEGNTTLNGEGDIATCVDYLVEKGVNCVQLMPIADFSEVDETSTANRRNWGYNPVNFNVPDGAYATDAYNGNTRINEFKQLVQALHDRGISVVMDVVYNHTYVLEGSALGKTVPEYYHRMSSSNTYYNGSGLGNCLSTEKAMTRKYVIESLKYWVEEYHIDGFRFDLMGAIDCTTLNQARAEIDSIDKRILMYGEPWAGGDTGIANGATNGNFGQLSSRIGGFNQTYAENLRGADDKGNPKASGFVQGGTANTTAVLNGAKGFGTYFNTTDISKQINYIDNHDNFVLWDKILASNNYSGFYTTQDNNQAYDVNYTAANNTDAAMLSQLKLSMLAVMTSQGTPFMSAGTEFGRTKYGDGNSYRTNDNINGIDWNRAKACDSESEYFAGLMDIRKAFKGFTDADADTVTNLSGTAAIKFSMTDNTAGYFKNVVVAMNNSKTSTATVTLPSGNWVVVANDKSAGTKSLGNASGTYTLPKSSGAIFVDATSFAAYNQPAEGETTLTVKHHVRDTETGAYTVTKTTSAKYSVGQTYRASVDNNILFDHNLDRWESTSGSLSGAATAGGNVTVDFYYTRFIESNYLTVNFKHTTSGETVRSHIEYRLKDGDEFSIPSTMVQGYELDTTKYPAGTKGEFDASQPKEFTFYYKDLSNTQTVVHYYCTKWSSIQCYAYIDATGEVEEPLGAWINNRPGQMTPDPELGANWYTVTIPNTKACRVIFHPSNLSIVGQDPGQGEPGYDVAGEAWIKDRVVTFSCDVVTSHIDLETGKQIASDSKKSYSNVTNGDMYATSGNSALGGFVTPANASGFFKAGTTNVVYLYDGSDPVIPGDSLTIGDTDLSGGISILDATAIQRYLAKLQELTDNAKLVADTDGNEKIEILDATRIQRYLAKLDNFGKVGEAIGGSQQQGEHTVEQLIDMYNTLSSKHRALDPDYYAEDAGYNEAGRTLNQYKSLLLDSSAATPEEIDEAYDACAASYAVIKDYDESAKIEIKTIDIYFSNNYKWSTVNYYCWGTAGEIGWPGRAMTKVTTNEMGEDIYKVTIDPAQYQNIIFNNGSQQTVDIAFNTTKNNVGYYITGTDANGKLTVETYEYTG